MMLTLTRLVLPVLLVQRRTLVSHILICFVARPARLLSMLLLVACSGGDAGIASEPSAPVTTTTVDAQTALAAPVLDAGVAGSVSSAPSPVPVMSSVPPDPTVCGGVTFKAQAKELEILVLFDDSWSMLLPAIGGDCLNTGVIEDCVSSTSTILWDVAVAELNDFARDPKSAGVSVAVKYFGTQCDPSFYAKPDIALGKLPEHAKAIADSLAARAPFEETATRPALEGALAYTQARAKTPGLNARQIILLVTDGFPDVGDCPDNSVESVARVAMQGSAAGVATYVFVTVPDVGLDPVAAAGGTERAISAQLKNVGALKAALGKVRDQELQALPCEYELPESYFKEVNDPGRVNLTRDGKALGRVDGAAACAANTDGWYYDDPASPRRILTCSAACASLKSAAAVDVQLKCPTVVLL